MKGISNILPSFTKTVLCLLCALGLSLGAYAQSRTVTVNVKDVTVKELLKAIEAGVPTLSPMWTPTLTFRARFR